MPLFNTKWINVGSREGGGIINTLFRCSHQPHLKDTETVLLTAKHFFYRVFGLHSLQILASNRIIKTLLKKPCIVFLENLAQKNIHNK